MIALAAFRAALFFLVYAWADLNCLKAASFILFLTAEGCVRFFACARICR